MTVFEHAMLGVTSTLAVGLHRRYGSPVVASAAVVAVLPDWDGLAILLGPAAFDRAHRTWGHNLLVASLSGALVMVCLGRFRLPQRLAGWAARRMGKTGPPGPMEGPRGGRGVALWLFWGLLVSWGHLAADVIYSGHAVLSDWGVPLLWPFSRRAAAWPLVPWGDVGTTLVFAAGMFAMARWPRRLQAIGTLVLVAVAGYILARGLFWPIGPR